MLTTFLLAATAGTLALTAAAVGLATQAPAKTIPQGFFERVANGGATLVMKGIAAGYYAKSGKDGAATPDAPVMLQVNFKVVTDHDSFVADMDDFAPFLSHVPGLTWKLWSFDAETGAGNGTYLFESRDHVDLYLAEILPVGMMNDPRIEDMTIQVLDVLTTPSAVTRAL